MEEPEACLNMPSGLFLSHCRSGWKWVLLQVFFLLHNATQFQGLLEQQRLYRTTSFPRVAQVQRTVPSQRRGNTHLNVVHLYLRESVCACRLTCLSLWVTVEAGGVQEPSSWLHTCTVAHALPLGTVSFSVSSQWHLTNNLFVHSCFAISFWQFVVQIIDIPKKAMVEIYWGKKCLVTSASFCESKAEIKCTTYI